MILRSDEGQIIYSTCRYLWSCSSVLEEELAACMEGINIARAWSSAPMIIETDCLVAAQMIVQNETNRSTCATQVVEIKRTLEEVGEHAISHLVRSRNKALHGLARMGHVE
ncbi:hypothetical protein ZWY2020_052112 [Hordeum vulgare]|nr:hypothetical protein ZWY2020_052112 [Hordeum vulgare]